MYGTPKECRLHKCADIANQAINIPYPQRKEAMARIGKRRIRKDSAAS